MGHMTLHYVCQQVDTITKDLSPLPGTPALVHLHGRISRGENASHTYCNHPPTLKSWRYEAYLVPASDGSMVVRREQAFVRPGVGGSM
jgi:hypothetical protein